MNVDLTFVIRSAASKKISVANGGFKSGAGPKIKRLRRLHIVMTVKKYRRLSGSAKRFAVNERMHFRRNNLNVFESSRTQLPSHPLRGTFHIGLVFTFGANAW